MIMSNIHLPKQKLKLCIYPITKSAQWYMLSMIFQFVMLPFLTSSNKFFSFDPELGAFGWMCDWDSFVLVFLINALITGILENIGFIYAFEYFSMQTVLGAMFFYPFIAQIAGIILGQDEIPWIYTIIGLMTISTVFFHSWIWTITQIFIKSLILY